MKIQFITFDHIKEAVKYLVSKNGETHLPYTDESGTPNHRLMGAAWAALHGGYRGNKYEGADKSKAIAKLKSVYKSENMDVPAESFVLEGEFFEEALAQSDSYDSIRSRVQSALDKAVRMGQDMDLDGDDDSANGCYCWVRDLFPGTVVYSMNGDLFQCDYSDDGETVTLGTPVEVEMSYTPVDAAKESGRPGNTSRAMQREIFTLSESAYDSSKGKLSVTIIKPGFSDNSTKGKRRYYPAETLKRDFKVFEGAKMFIDHATEAEQKARPEGSVHDWVANLSDVFAESDGTLKGTASVFDPTFKAKLDALNSQGMLKQMAVSMRSAVAWSPQEIEGQEAARIEELIAARSVDFVTYAGAGGQVEAMESQPSDAWDVDVIGEAELRKRRPDLVEVIESSAQGAKMKSLEQQLQEANTQLAAEKKRADEATAKVTESEKVAKKATTQTELSKLLTESKLPEVSQKRIRDQYKDAVEITGIKESIDAEKEYLKSLSGAGVVKGMGKSQNGGDVSESGNSRESLVESFKAAGFTEDQAKLAAAGR